MVHTKQQAGINTPCCDYVKFYAFLSIKNSIERNNKGITMARWENRLQNSSSEIGCNKLLPRVILRPHAGSQM